jgi:hypothetical protein
VTTVGLAAGEEVEAVLGESTAICGDANHWRKLARGGAGDISRAERRDG